MTARGPICRALSSSGDQLELGDQLESETSSPRLSSETSSRRSVGFAREEVHFAEIVEDDLNEGDLAGLAIGGVPHHPVQSLG
jgi:hypothetical protein